MATAGRWVFWPVVAVVVVLDLITKQLAVAMLGRVPVYLLGEWLSLRLVYNRGAAFGIHVGEYSRVVFTLLALVALVVLGAMARQTKAGDRTRLVALALVCGGAVGNLIDRLRTSRGVVDFIDVWIGSFHWPTFNVADMAVSCGAILLAVVLWQEGKDGERASPQADAAELSP
ncbi:MAG: signal peptidase II [Gemmatimonadota bacterium]|nr:signal peptidase II [Gemmatimonadota bacterium]MDH4350608.1 signal peptidase II [Gemmatimonadota bacterium]MDH5197829.1 signal peptidase II [Gemmatimonadota bacterium]